MKQRMDDIISVRAWLIYVMEVKVFEELILWMWTQKENIYTIPNLLCVLRMGSAPILGYMILTKQYEPAIGIFAFAGITDLVSF